MAFAVFSITHISENIDLKKLIHIQKDLYQVQDYFEKMSIMKSLMFISDSPFKEVTYSFISLFTVSAKQRRIPDTFCL